MTRRELLVLLAATGGMAAAPPPPPGTLPAPAPLTAADEADLARISAYLNGVKTLKAKFLQVAPDGAVSRGIVWMERPGRMRFQYDPPTPLLLVAGGGLFVFYDRQLNQTTNIPLGSTPLSLLLSEKITLSGDVTVMNVDRQPGQVAVTLRRTATPGDGSLTLIFGDAPLVLRQWIVVDAQRQETRVTLYDVELGGNFDEQMFYFINPKFLPGQANKVYH